ncbi:DUF6398 domain-containing protein [Desulfosarcina sp.]|uniref:DUF6398 domain-containing protein n=1 Tax=Desulfosarcina sp. TaxID=2027861 RepID=UPI0029A65D3B|nr:DUF6398 domain-containing protein [Desulfosarcina sp.]MDX2453497.1 DUF6398 domain-containing protein [Desulfosarcina sp.]
MRTEKKPSVPRILNLIEQFCDAHLNDEYHSYAMGLMDRITNMPDLNLSRGRPEIWAATIVTVIARLNFLFDKADLDAITMEDISAFFGTVKSTIGNKATVVEEACDIGMGEPGLCREEITEALTVYETPEGFIVPLSMLSDRGEVVKHADKRHKTQKNSPTTNNNRLPVKNKKDNRWNDRQLSLFDDF